MSQDFVPPSELDSHFGKPPELPWTLLALTRRLERYGLDWTPSVEFLTCHVPVIVDCLWQRLLQAVRHPVTVGTLYGHRAVQVLGLYLYVRQEDHNGTLDVSTFGCDGHGRPAWTIPHEAGINLSNPAQGWGWLDRVQGIAAWEIRRFLQGRRETFKTDLLDRYLAELFAHLRSQLRRHADLSLMRRRIARALQLDSQTMDMAYRLTEATPAALSPTPRSYNLAIRFRSQLEAVRRTHPGLLPLVAAGLEERRIDDRLPPLQALKAALDEEGLPPRIWRLLLKASPRVFLPIRSARSWFRSNWQRMLQILRVYADFGIDRELPVSMATALLRLEDDPDYQYGPYDDQQAPWRDQVGRAFRSLLRDSAGASRREELEAVLYWLVKARPRLDHCQRKAGWPWLVRQARDWELREHLQQADAEGAAPRTMPAQVVDGLLLQPICTRSALWEEGKAMRHCAFDRLHAMIDGTHLLFSVRRARRPGRRLATAELCRDEGAWRVGQVAGFANEAVDPRIGRAVERLAGRLNFGEVMLREARTGRENPVGQERSAA